MKFSDIFYANFSVYLYKYEFYAGAHQHSTACPTITFQLQQNARTNEHCFILLHFFFISSSFFYYDEKLFGKLLLR